MTSEYLTPTTFVNLTPSHLVVDGIGPLPPSGVVARITYERHLCPAVAGGVAPVRVIRQDFGPVQNIPAPSPGYVYIVSAIVVSAILVHADNPTIDRLGVDIFAPDTGPDAIRDRGQVVGVRGLVW